VASSGLGLKLGLGSELGLVGAAGRSSGVADGACGLFTYAHAVLVLLRDRSQTNQIHDLGLGIVSYDLCIGKFQGALRWQLRS